MTVTFTLEQIMLLLFFILGAAAIIYLLVVLKNVNKLIVNADNVIRQNEKNIAGLLLHMEELSKNTAGFSRELKNQFSKYDTAVGSVLQSSAQSMLMISETTDRIRNLTANINEMIKIVTHLFKK